MSIKRISFIILILLSLTTASMLVWRQFRDAPPVDAPTPTAKAPPPPAASPPVSPSVSKASPPLPVSPSPDSTEETVDVEEERSEQEEIAAALAQLNSPDAEQRLEGAEQLGAYATREVETALTHALGGDSDAGVRSAAAQSLGYVEKPSEATLNALLTALEDPSDEVRLNALSALEDFLLGSDEDSARYKKIMSGLKARGTARSVPQDTQEAIHDILEDQTANAPQ